MGLFNSLKLLFIIFPNVTLCYLNRNRKVKKILTKSNFYIRLGNGNSVRKIFLQSRHFRSSKQTRISLASRHLETWIWSPPEEGITVINMTGPLIGCLFSSDQSHRALEIHFETFTKYGGTNDYLRLDLWRQFQWRHFCCPRFKHSFEYFNFSQPFLAVILNETQFRCSFKRWRTMKKSFKHCTVRLIQKILSFNAKTMPYVQTNVSNIYRSFVAEFENMSNSEKFLTQDLEDMLSYIAKTGRVL